MGLVRNGCHIFETVSRLQPFSKAVVKVWVLLSSVLSESRWNWWPDDKISFRNSLIRPEGLQLLENTVI